MSKLSSLSEELLAVFVTLDKQVNLERTKRLRHVNGEPVANPQNHPQIVELVAVLEDLEILARQYAADVTQEKFKYVQTEHDRHADTCLTSLESFRQSKRQRLLKSMIQYQIRLAEGEDMDIAIRRAQYELDRLNEDCEHRRQQIESRRHVQANTPLLLNLALLVTEG